MGFIDCYSPESVCIFKAFKTVPAHRSSVSTFAGVFVIATGY